MDQETNIESIKEQILNKTLFALAWLSIPTLGSSLFRITYSGWSTLFLLHIGFVLFLWAMYFFRSRVSLHFKVISICLLGLITGLLGAYSWGLVGGWQILLTIPPIIFALFYGKRYGLLSIIASGAFLIVIALIDIDKYSILLHPINSEGNATFFWLNTIITFVFLTSPLVFLVGQTRYFLETQINAQKKQAQIINDAKSELADTIDLLPVGISIATLDGKILNSNKRFVELFGYEKNDIPTVDDWFQKAYPDSNYRQQVLDQWENDVRLSMQHQTQLPPRIYTITTASLNSLQVEVSFRTINHKIIVIFKDLTARIEYEKSLEVKKEELRIQNEAYLQLNKELEDNNQKITEINKKLEEAKTKAEQSDHFKTAFLQNMSHEIRTPLNGIIGFSEMLKQKDLSREQRTTYSNIVIKSGQQLLAILNDVVSLSSLEAGQEQINAGAINVHELLSGLVTMFQPEAHIKGLQLLLESPPENPLTKPLISDEKKLLQVLNNLTSNAIKFTLNGQVSIGYHQTGVNEITFYVKDTGIGIRKELHDTIFERFMQGDIDISNNFGGTGLGLTISKSIVTLLGGSISLKSIPAEGSTFCVSLPLEMIR
jgi:signal transduction histidine kinase